MMRNERFAAGRTDMACGTATSWVCNAAYERAGRAREDPRTSWSMLKASKHRRGVGMAAHKNAWRRGADTFARVYSGRLRHVNASKRASID